MCRYFASGRLLVGPVAVLVEVPPGAVLVVAIAVAGDRKAVEEVEEPDGQAGADEQRPRLDADRVAAHDEDDETRQDHEGGEHPAHDEEGVPPTRAATGARLGHGTEATRPTESWTRASGPFCKSAPVWIGRRSPSGGVLTRSWAWRPTPSLRPGRPAPATAQTRTDSQDGPLRRRIDLRALARPGRGHKHDVVAVHGQELVR